MKKNIIKLSVMFCASQLWIGTAFAQLPLNVNKTLGLTNQGTTQGVGSEDWNYGVKTLPGGDFLTTGYSTDVISSPAVRNPTIVKYDMLGNVLWEQKYTCISGVGVDIYDLPNGYLMIGAGKRNGGCADPDDSFFSLLVDKTSGTLDQTYGVKMYNCQTLPFPPGQNGLVHTKVGAMISNRPTSCEIKNNSGQITGFMLCGNYIDDSFPSNTSTFGQNSTNGCFLLKIDVNGLPDPTFGTSGLQTYLKNLPGKYFQPHFFDVCVNYDGLGNVLGYVAVGAVNESITTFKQWGDFDMDAFFMMVNTSGTVTYYDVFDETTHLKNTATPLSYPYTDTPDYLVCPNNITFGAPNLPQENTNERATSVAQIGNGMDFIILSQNDWRLVYHSCPLVFPSTNAFYISSDPGVLRVDPFGNVIWATNVTQSSGRDFNNAVLVTPSNEILVLGAINTEPNPGTPVDQKALVSKLSPTGVIIYENVYDETSSGQTKICPFAFDFDQSGGIIMVGDNQLNGDDYAIIGFSPY
ncbi:MAG: hypothetical protein IT236_00840 [Bacteroidia bacterium]|nr:hypothetical protein [Bacteroidia bacterium]